MISVLGLIGLLSDAWVSGAGARQGGATVLNTLGGLAIGLIGLFAAGPLGFLGGILLGTYVLEYSRHRDPELALRATFGMGIGYGASFIVKFLLGIGMIAAWVAWLSRHPCWQLAPVQLPPWLNQIPRPPQAQPLGPPPLRLHW